MARRWAGTGLAVLALGGCAQMSGLETRARILSEPPCTDFFFPIYYRDRAVEPPAPARALVGTAGQHARGCALAKVEVTGLPDPAARDPRLDLLARRAARLDSLLQAAGLTRAEFHLSPLGDTAAPAAKLSPRRRVDIYVRFRR